MKIKRLLILGLLSIFSVGCTTNENKSSEPASKDNETNLVISTEFGDVQGYSFENTLIWQGIPYADDTSGDNRWKAPKDPKKWSGILDATTAGEKFLQLSSEGVVGSEDALNLDIYRTDTTKNNLPVMVYIHGGNNQTGNAQEISGISFTNEYDSIVVSVNYRLGVLGFNPLEAMKNGDKEENSGNYGLLDIAKALEWIQENIENFGGNPNNITLTGFSAGGRDVMASLISPIFEDKFNQAIVFSGGMTIADEKSSQQVVAEAIAPLVVEDGKQKSKNEAIQWLLGKNNDVTDYLYNLDGNRLAKLMANAGLRMEVFPHLFNDGYVIPTEGFDTKKYNDVPIIMATGEMEFSLFAQFDPYFAEAASDGTIFTDEEINKEYNFVNSYGGQLYSLFNVENSAEKMHNNYNSLIYGMEISFGNDEDIVGEDMAKIGSFHGVWVPMFDTTNENYSTFIGDAYKSEGSKDMSEQFKKYIYQFISTGNPNGEDLNSWNEWDFDSKQVLQFDATKETANIKMKKNNLSEKQIIENIQKDTSLSESKKQELVKNVLNSRWFSRNLDMSYENLNYFYK